LTVIHVFEENSKSARSEHIKRYFGLAPGGLEDEWEDGSYIICYCGGRLVPMGKDKENKEVAAVWHKLVMGNTQIKDDNYGE
jgi:hypothetical protein